MTRTAFTALMVVAFVALAVFVVALRSSVEEQEACAAACMAEHRTRHIDIAGGRCFCALKPGNGWDVPSSDWVEVQP